MKMSKKKTTIEDKVKRSILGEPTTMKIGRHTYTIKPATIGTLIRMSAAISHLPAVDEEMTPQDRVSSILNYAKDCESLQDIVAIIITQRGEQDGSIFQRWQWKRIRRRALCLSSNELFNIVDKALEPQEVGTFFGISTFLSKANLIKPTKVDTETTASGQ